MAWNSSTLNSYFVIFCFFFIGTPTEYQQLHLNWLQRKVYGFCGCNYRIRYILNKKSQIYLFAWFAQCSTITTFNDSLHLPMSLSQIFFSPFWIFVCFIHSSISFILPFFFLVFVDINYPRSKYPSPSSNLSYISNACVRWIDESVPIHANK